ncbi:hypothetical protein NQ315_000775 [Exocentrus adspersus]|uniref:BHLH domain-containing protein n=1 Tax=Exocentrus adspersus TaxID=1586481 RepID=A0AAV8WD52_9CUCU|nr:hypothetical protein NQ315_000775 [Exocentrus adspersus]
MRNKAEKQRRDRLNAFIGELATLVPMVARSAKRMDKTSILRLTATHLRIYQTLINGKGGTAYGVTETRRPVRSGAASL